MRKRISLVERAYLTQARVGLDRGTQMRRSFRLVLPILMGAVSAILIAWDIHNQRIIMSMGMAWDTGAPLWPYQTPDTLLSALNFPAYLIATPVSRILGLLAPRHYLALFPAILFWWWLVGRFLDELLGNASVRKATLLALVLCVLAILLAYLGISGCIDVFRWWRTYSREVLGWSVLIPLRLIAPSMWCFALSLAALMSAKRRAGVWPSSTRRSD
jgi:hypothetical protein